MRGRVRGGGVHPRGLREGATRGDFKAEPRLTFYSLCSSCTRREEEEREKMGGGIREVHKSEATLTHTMEMMMQFSAFLSQGGRSVLIKSRH